MYSRKPQTILTSRMINSKNAKRSAQTTIKEPSFTSPAESHYGTMYINIAGVAMPIK